MDEFQYYSSTSFFAQRSTTIYQHLSWLEPKRKIVWIWILFRQIYIWIKSGLPYIFNWRAVSCLDLWRMVQRDNCLETFHLRIIRWSVFKVHKMAVNHYYPPRVHYNSNCPIADVRLWRLIFSRSQKCLSSFWRRPFSTFFHRLKRFECNLRRSHWHNCLLDWKRRF